MRSYLVGICAGSRTREKAELGDIVVPSTVFNDSIYKIKIDEIEEKVLKQIYCNGTPNARLHRLCMGIQHNPKIWRRKIKRPSGVICTPKVFFDPIVTNNIFLQDGGKYITEFQNCINRKIIAYEMEAGGFANACHSEEVPFLVIRGISDFADESASNNNFRPHAARVAAAFALEVAKHALIPD